MYRLPVRYANSPLVGDFEEIYGGDAHNGESHAGQWDAVLTCFFIDTVRLPPPAALSAR